MLQKALTGSSWLVPWSTEDISEPDWFFLAGNFSTLCLELTADLELTTDLEITTGLESIPDRYVENTQAFKMFTDRESNTLNFAEKARGHGWFQFNFWVTNMQLSLMFIMTGAPDQTSISMESNESFSILV